MYLVVWSTGEGDDIQDHWEAFHDEELEGAIKRYKEVVELEDIYVASFTLVADSTDYMPSQHVAQSVKSEIRREVKLG